MRTMLIHARMFRTAIGMTLLAGGISAWASEAATSASAAAQANRPSGTAGATARYVGDVGFTRTDTRTGPVNAARAVAVGVDERGLTLSVSTAIAPRFGPALATNFNVTINDHGQAAVSVGTAVARGGAERSVSTSGSAVSRLASPAATSVASGKTSAGGVVHVATDSASSPRPHAGVSERGSDRPRERIAARRVIRIS
jgi:hypothetical protein